VPTTAQSRELSASDWYRTARLGVRRRKYVGDGLWGQQRHPVEGNRRYDFRRRAGANPAGSTFDASNIWVANYGANTVTKLRGVDGVNLGTFNVGTKPIAIAFDGACIWVGNCGSNTVSKLHASDGSLVGT
jgi:DNA-binding beta-propeller fold protein YncE